MCLKLNGSIPRPASAEDEDEPRPSFLLDIGAGSGLSGEILTEEGHDWVGLDISGGMLGTWAQRPEGGKGALIPWDSAEVALERDIEGDLFLADIGQGIPFRAGSFDGAISYVVSWGRAGEIVLTPATFAPRVSVLQWLCNADASAHSPPQRLLRFFTDLFGVLTRGSRAVFQFYPESDEQVKFIMNFATKAGFGGGLCVDYVRSPYSSLPRTKANHIWSLLPAQLVQKVTAKRCTAPRRSTLTSGCLTPRRKKFYLVLFAGQPADPALRKPQAVPAGLGVEGAGQVAYERKRAERGSKSKGGKRKGVKDIDWILKKKELYRARGKEGVPRDSKCVFYVPPLSVRKADDRLQVHGAQPETSLLKGWFPLYGSFVVNSQESRRRPRNRRPQKWRRSASIGMATPANTRTLSRSELYACQERAAPSCSRPPSLCFPFFPPMFSFSPLVVVAVVLVTAPFSLAVSDSCLQAELALSASDFSTCADIQDFTASVLTTQFSIVEPRTPPLSQPCRPLS